MNSVFFFTNITIAFEALKRSRTRTYLTMLGIIIGVSAVSYVLTLGHSFQAAAVKQVASLKNNIIVVRPGSEQKGILSEQSIVSYSPLTPYATTTITEKDYNLLKEKQSIKHIAPLMLINGNVRTDKKTNDSARILATTPSFAKTLELDIREGQFIDDTVNRDTVVIGKQLAIDLFGSDAAIGSRLYIRGQPHTVIGILKTHEATVGVNGVDLNFAAIIPFEGGKSFNQGIAQIQQFNIIPVEAAQQKAVMNDVKETLTSAHNGEHDVTVMDGKEAVLLSRQFYDFTTLLTAIIASISLVVGGVGIMNIMLVGVAERTREIGVRKSLGASNYHVLWQFLIEAMIMSMSGGVIGVVLGVSLAAGTCLFFQIIPALSIATIALSLLMSVCVGLLFGIMPAYQAAKKDPIEALRHQS
jgi:putative ABC transport system permease protein